MDKYCGKCKKSLPIESFAFKSKLRKKYCAYCKVCNRIYQKRHYLLNADDYKNKRTVRRERVRREYFKLIRDYLESHHCIDCGEKDILVLEFDHVRGEKFSEVTTMINDTYSWDKILKEIDKCDVRCANCHRRKTAKQFGWYLTHF